MRILSAIKSFYQVHKPSDFKVDEAKQEKLLKAFGFQTFLAGTIGYSLYYVCRTSLNVVKKPILDSGMLDASQLGVIGKGCFVAEIQQTSDLTYRIYDFGRLGLDGKPRQLHTELAMVFIWEYFYHMCNKK